MRKISEMEYKTWEKGFAMITKSSTEKSVWDYIFSLAFSVFFS